MMYRFICKGGAPVKVTSSYAVHVQDHRQPLKATVSIYRAAVAFMIDVVDKEWDTLPPICAAGGNLGSTPWST